VGSDGWRTLRARLRSQELLVVDGFEAVLASPRCQRELVHVLDGFSRSGACAVLTARRPPGHWDEVAGAVPARLRSLTLAGVTVSVARPGLELRRRFVLERVHGRGIALSEDAIDWLAGNAAGFRELDGCLTTLAFAARVAGPHDASRALGAEEVISLLSNRPHEAAPAQVDLNALARAVARHFGVRVGDLTGPSHERRFSEARHLAIWLAREETGASFAALGRHFGGRDPKTVRYACERSAARIGRTLGGNGRGRAGGADSTAHAVRARGGRR
jgi:chromosomal replication initiator protein